jgi:hypothetical protein
MVEAMVMAARVTAPVMAAVPMDVVLTAGAAPDGLEHDGMTTSP